MGATARNAAAMVIVRIVFEDGMRLSFASLKIKK
jgi:hypothetical protein